MGNPSPPFTTLVGVGRQTVPDHAALGSVGGVPEAVELFAEGLLREGFGPVGDGPALPRGVQVPVKQASVTNRETWSDSVR